MSFISLIFTTYLQKLVIVASQTAPIWSWGNWWKSYGFVMFTNNMLGMRVCGSVGKRWGREGVCSVASAT